MRRYGAKKVPKGASTRNFALLSATEQRDSVRKLKASGFTTGAIIELTGLSAHKILQLLGESVFGLAAPKAEGTTVCRYCYFTPDKCICTADKS